MLFLATTFVVLALVRFIWLHERASGGGTVDETRLGNIESTISSTSNTVYTLTSQVNELGSYTSHSIANLQSDAHTLAVASNRTTAFIRKMNESIDIMTESTQRLDAPPLVLSLSSFGLGSLSIQSSLFRSGLAEAGELEPRQQQGPGVGPWRGET